MKGNLVMLTLYILYTGLCAISFGPILMNDWGLPSVLEELASTSARISRKNFVKGIDSL